MLLLLCLAPAQVNAQTPVGIAVGGDNLTRLLWNNPDGSISLWRLDAYGGVASQTSYGPYTGWSGKSLATGTDNVSRILWTNTNGTAALWRINSDGSSPNTNYGPYSGWTAANVTVGGDNTSRLLWNNTSGQMAHWSVAANGTFTDAEYGPFTGYTAFQVAAGPNSVPRTLWNKSDGGISLWNSVYGDANYSYPDYGPFAGYSPVALAVDSNNAPRILWSYPSNRMVSLWRVAPDGTYTYRYYTNPNYNYFPVALAAGTGGDVRLLWSAGQGSALVWTIKADGTYTQTYTTVARAPQAVLVQVSPITITAGSTASGFINGIHPTTNGTTVYLSSDSPSVQVPYSVAVAANSYTVTFPVTTTAGTYDYTPATITALVNADPATKGTATVTVYTPSGTTTTGGGSPSGGSPSGGTGSGGTGTGGSGGTGTGGSGGTGTGGSGGTGTGGSGGVASYGHYDVTYSGGTITTQDGSGAGTVTPTTDSYGYGGTANFRGNSSSSASTYISAKIQGPLTATFTWVADAAYPNSPPPAQAIVTENCNFSWQLYDPNNGVSGSYSTDLGQTGSIAASSNSSGGGSKTFSVNTGSSTSFSVSCNPLGSISGYTYYGCTYDVFGFSFMAAAAFANISLTAPDPAGRLDLGDNKYTYTRDKPTGYLYIPGALKTQGNTNLDAAWLTNNSPSLKIENPALPNGIAYQWVVSGLTASVTTPNNNYPTYTSGTLIFAGLPSANSGFGTHDANLYIKAAKTDTAKIQTFFPGTVANWPNSDGTPNWYHYYNQVSTATGSYASGTASNASADGFGTSNRTSTIKIEDDAYSDAVFNVFGLNANISPYVIYLGKVTTRGIHTFVETSAHEQGHKNAWLASGIETMENGLDAKGASVYSINLVSTWKDSHHLKSFDSNGNKIYDTTGAYQKITSQGLPPDPGDVECLADIQALKPCLDSSAHWQDDWADTGLQTGYVEFYQNGVANFYWDFHADTTLSVHVTPTGSPDASGAYHISNLADLQKIYPGTTILTSLSQLGP